MINISVNMKCTERSNIVAVASKINKKWIYFVFWSNNYNSHLINLSVFGKTTPMIFHFIFNFVCEHFSFLFSHFHCVFFSAFVSFVSIFLSFVFCLVFAIFPFQTKLSLISLSPAKLRKIKWKCFKFVSVFSTSSFKNYSKIYGIFLCVACINWLKSKWERN